MEIKTYQCDRCSIRGSSVIHIKIPCVDGPLPGFVDLCPEHIEKLIPEVMELYTFETARRGIWKHLLGVSG